MNNKRIVVIGQSAKKMLEDDSQLRKKNLNLLKKWISEEAHTNDNKDNEEK